MTASFDHYVVAWDYNALINRAKQKEIMRLEDIKSRKIEVYHRMINDKKNKGGAKKQVKDQAKKKKKGK